VWRPLSLACRSERRRLTWVPIRRGNLIEAEARFGGQGPHGRCRCDRFSTRQLMRHGPASTAERPEKAMKALPGFRPAPLARATSLLLAMLRRNSLTAVVGKSQNQPACLSCRVWWLTAPSDEWPPVRPAAFAPQDGRPLIRPNRRPAAQKEQAKNAISKRQA